MKALIPAAGLGTRWHPWSRVVPKELLPLGRYPAIHYVLEETVDAGINEVGIIIGEAKQLIKKYVNDVWLVNHSDIHVRWFYQPSPQGVGDALLRAKEWIEGKPTAVLYPDIIHPRKGGMSKVSAAFQGTPGCWIGLTGERPERRHMAFAIEKTGQDFFRIHGPCSEGSIVRVGYGTGRFILANGFSHLQGSLFDTKNQNGEELDDDRIFAPLWNEQDVRGIILPKPIYDIGSPRNWHFVISQTYDSARDE